MTTIKLHCGGCGSDIEAPTNSPGSTIHDQVRAIFADWVATHASCWNLAAAHEAEPPPTGLGGSPGRRLLNTHCGECSGHENISIPESSEIGEAEKAAWECTFCSFVGTTTFEEMGPLLPRDDGQA